MIALVGLIGTTTSLASFDIDKWAPVCNTFLWVLLAILSQRNRAEVKQVQEQVATAARVAEEVGGVLRGQDPIQVIAHPPDPGAHPADARPDV